MRLEHRTNNLANNGRFPIFRETHPCEEGLIRNTKYVLNPEEHNLLCSREMQNTYLWGLPQLRWVYSNDQKYTRARRWAPGCKVFPLVGDAAAEHKKSRSDEWLRHRDARRGGGGEVVTGAGRGTGPPRRGASSGRTPSPGPPRPEPHTQVCLRVCGCGGGEANGTIWVQTYHWSFIHSSFFVYDI